MRARFQAIQVWAIGLAQNQGRTAGPWPSMAEAKRVMRDEYRERTWERDWNGTDWVGDRWYLTPNEPKAAPRA
jgi:hypothetical protein